MKSHASAARLDADPCARCLRLNVVMPPSAGGHAAPFNLLESRFRGAIAASLDAFFLCESVRDSRGIITDFRIVELNERGEAFLARPRAELLGKLVCDVLPSVRASGLLHQMIDVVESGDSIEDELRVDGEDGQLHWVRHQVVRVDDGIAITSREITKRKQVEESLHESEARFRHLVESASDGIYRIDPRGVFTYANPVASRLLGFSPDNIGIVGRVYLDFVRPDFHAEGIALYRSQILERIPVTYWEFPVVAVNGRELWIGQNVHIEQQNGRVTSLFAVARDITVRRNAEMALRESEERHRFLAEHSTDLLSRLFPDGLFFYVSPACFGLLGYIESEVVGTSVFEYCHEDDLDAMRAANNALLGTSLVETLTYRIRRRDGHFIWFETTSQAVRDPITGRVSEILSVSRDVTERRRLEEQLRHAQKMEAVGQLAGGVAHDFNNLLTTIRGFGDLIARDVEPDDPRRRDVGEILRATERAAELTRQLLAFSKRQVLRLEPVSLNGVVEDMINIIRRMLGDAIQVETRLDPDIWVVRADPGQLEHSLLNLALNARDAMTDGGTLRISTRNADLSFANGVDAVIPPGRYAVLEVADSGVGMTEETRLRVFEPFFTTKDPGDGTGLGLATVFGIVTQSGGHVGVASSIGEGTTFTVHLPVIPDSDTSGRLAGGERLRSKSGNAILIAEDNEGVRALTVRLLADAGYRVYEGVDGMDALETLRALDEPVDLLITDVMMPRMNGSELAAHFQRIQPGSPILLISGYIDEDTVRRAFNHPDAVVPKPFTAEALLGRVRELIGTAR